MSARDRLQQHEVFLWWLRSRPGATPRPAAHEPAVVPARAAGGGAPHAAPSPTPSVGGSGGVRTPSNDPRHWFQKTLGDGSEVARAIMELSPAHQAIRELHQVKTLYDQVADELRDRPGNHAVIAERLRTLSHCAYMLAYRQDLDLLHLPAGLATALNQRILLDNKWEVVAVMPGRYSSSQQGMDFPTGFHECRPITFAIRGPSGTVPAEAQGLTRR